VLFVDRKQVKFYTERFQMQVADAPEPPPSVYLHEIWPRVQVYLPEVLVRWRVQLLESEVLEGIRPILLKWVDMPDRHASGYAFRKDFRNTEELTQALVGNFLAAANREIEERLAWGVITNFHLYEEMVVNPLIGAMFSRLDLAALQKMNSDQFYGPIAMILIDSEDVPAVVRRHCDREPNGEESPPHVRLVKKIAFVHKYSRCARFWKEKTPHRDEHAGMRLDPKWTLDETHPDVERDRAQGVSVWAGTSGSAMDIVFAAIQFGVTDPLKLTALAWCIFAFFHILPTSVSSTHTFHEVMRGVKKLVPEMPYNPEVAQLPSVDFVMGHAPMPQGDPSTMGGGK
jgi:hypothetical protein